MASGYKGYVIGLVFSMLLLLLMQNAAAEEGIQYLPTTGGVRLKEGPVVVDVTNADSGYIMIKHGGTKNRLKVLITNTHGQNRYNLKADGAFETFPLTHGSGIYGIAVYEQNKGDPEDLYHSIFGTFIKAEMPDENAAYLYPNQYVWFTNYSWAAAKSQELCRGAPNEMEKVERIYAFITNTIHYDYIKAVTIAPDYIPEVDVVLREEIGICLDYASLFACMLRVQGIPAQLVTGDVQTNEALVKHAWNKVFVGNAWLMVDPTHGDRRYHQAQYQEQHRY